MIKNLNDYKVEIIDTLETLRDDAQMALDGIWDCTTDEGIETGFGAQTRLIDELLKKIK